MTATSRLQKAFGPESSVECFDERIVGRFARTGEVQRHVVRTGPEVQVAGQVLGPLVQSDRLRLAALRTYLVKGFDNVLSSIAGLRSTFRDWAAERTHYPADMAEVALAHKISNAVEAAYRRGDMIEKRRAMMADWADHLTGAKRAGKIVAMGRL